MLELILQSSFVPAATDAIIQTAEIVGIIAAIAISVMTKLGITGKLMAIAKTTLTYSQKTTEQEAKLSTIIDVLYKLTPKEQRQTLDDIEKLLIQYSRDANVSAEQLTRLKTILVELLGNKSDPDKDPDLPR